MQLQKQQKIQATFEIWLASPEDAQVFSKQKLFDENGRTCYLYVPPEGSFYFSKMVCKENLL